MGQSRYAFIFYGYVLYIATQIVSNAILSAQNKAVAELKYAGIGFVIGIILIVIVLEIAYDMFTEWHKAY